MRRREWLGFSLALLFGMCGNVALAGWLIAPAAVPSWLTRLAVELCATTWVLSQALLLWQGVLAKRRVSGLNALLKEARSAMAAGEIESAALALDSGAAVDDESAELYVLKARLCALTGDDRGRRAAWRRVLKLDRNGRHGAEARQALEPPREAGDRGIREDATAMSPENAR